MAHAYLVHQMLEEAAQSRPESDLVVDARERATYGEIEGRSNRIARVLRDEGVLRGDRVGLVAANSTEYVSSYYGILKAGAIVVALNATGDPRGHADLLRDCGAVAAICGGRAARAATVFRGVDGVRAVLTTESVGPTREGDRTGARLIALGEALTAASPEPLGLPLIDQDRAAIVYTSGSTAAPRGAVLRHANLVANTRSVVAYLGLTSADRILVVLPFHYVYGKSLLNTHVAVGGCVVIENRFLYPQEALNTLEREGATGLAGVPSTFAILLNKSNLAERDLPSLRYVTQAGGPMAPEMQRRLVAALPGKRVFIMYGATEASARLSFLDPEDLLRKIGSIGKAIPNVELRVVREDGSEADVGEVGEIVARGSNIMEGYWNAPEETADVLDDLGYHTGDLGRRDDEGFLYVVGRKRQMIKSGAHRISPLEIEGVLVENETVHEAAVVGVPDEILGEAIVAFVTCRDSRPATPDDLKTWCRSRLPAHKVPHAVHLRDGLPRNASGKIDKPALVREAATVGAENARWDGGNAR